MKKLVAIAKTAARIRDAWMDDASREDINYLIDDTLGYWLKQ